MAIYQIETEIKKRMRELKLTTRELANELQMPPGTLANQLGGWSPLSEENRRAIQQILFRVNPNPACIDQVHK